MRGVLGQYRCLTSPNGKSDGWCGQAGLARDVGGKWAPQGPDSIHAPPVHPRLSEASSQEMPSWTPISHQLVISITLSIIFFMVLGVLNAPFIVTSLNVSSTLPFMLKARTDNLYAIAISLELNTTEGI